MSWLDQVRPAVTGKSTGISGNGQFKITFRFKITFPEDEELTEAREVKAKDTEGPS